MIRLFLENHEIELDSNVQFAITKTFEDVTSPADIKNDWSKTVEIPFTQKNNKIFGMLFNTDRLIVDGDSKLMGIYFDPYKKVDFRLQWGDAIIMQGYAKNVNVVKNANGTGHYNITLNGELGKVFQEMKKITFDKTTEDTTYLIDGSKYVSETINKDLVYKLWTSEPNLNDLTLYETSDANYKVEDVLGFAPNNSFNEDFDYKTFQYLDSVDNQQRSRTFTEVLNSKAKQKGYEDYEFATGIGADTVVGDGLLPRAIGEFRSYLQLPYIYFNKLFNILLEKTKQVTGYDYELDEVWFNNTNPYWSNLTYMLKQLDYKGELITDSKNTELATTIFTLNLIDGEIQQAPNTYTPSANSTNFKPVYTGQTNFEQSNTFYIDNTVPLKIILTTPRDNNAEVVETTTDDKVIFNSGTHLYVIYNLKDKDGNIVNTYRNVIISEDYGGGSINGDWNIIKVKELRRNDTTNTFSTIVNTKCQFIIDETYSGEYTIECATYFNSFYAYYFYLNEEDTYLKNRLVFDSIELRLDKTDFIETRSKGRTGYKFTLNDLWDNEFNLFNEVLDYCKMFRIGVFCDSINKKLIFKPLSKYFSEYSVLDWTDKLDMSKEYHIQPITFEDKYLLFNYNGIDTQLNKDYAEKYGVKYGEYKLVTEYEFNNETKKLYDGIYNSIPSSDAVLSWGNIYDNLNIVYILPAEILPNNLDKDKKCMDIFGSFFIYNGLADWDTTSGLRSVKITDDTSLQIINNLYFYTQDAEGDKNRIAVPTYPLLDIKAEGVNICVFATPAENYTYKKDNYNNTMGIYKNFWENYLNERYNKQNKIVTCYLRLTPYDIANFQYNNFVKIENQLYFVNKIYDYCIDENTTTKVDLITIQNIEGYTKNNFVANYIFVVYDWNYSEWVEGHEFIDLKYNGDKKTIYITSTTDIKWVNTDFNLNGVTVNGEVGSGVIHAGDKVPVTIECYNEHENKSGSFIFTNGITSVEVGVTVSLVEGFFITKENGEIWKSNIDHLNFTQEQGGDVQPNNYILYCYSATPVSWVDENGNLGSEFRLNQDRGSGIIPAGNPTVLYIWFEWLDESHQGDIVFTNDGKEIRVGVEGYTIGY